MALDSPAFDMLAPNQVELPATQMALTFSHAEGRVSLNPAYPMPKPRLGETIVRVLRAGICSTDLEICRGYVPGFCGVLGHEFVGVVVQLPPDAEGPCKGADGSELQVGSRVVGEINCNDAHFTCGNAIMQRNHAPGRTVLGIIGRDGALAQYVQLPAANLHTVPQGLSDMEAAFAEPLAAACRILEQGLPRAPKTDRVAVVGDGKLGLLCAAVLATEVARRSGQPVTVVGRHAEKLALLEGMQVQPVAPERDGPEVMAHLAEQFDLVVEASGSTGGIRTALALCRPLGTIILKTTVSSTTTGHQQQQQEGAHADGCMAHATPAPLWSELAMDIVVNEKLLLGSRCGPFPMALQLLAASKEATDTSKPTRWCGYGANALQAHDGLLARLLPRLVAAELPLERGEEAMRLAGQKGLLKVQVVMP